MKKNLVLIVVIALVTIGGIVAFVWSYNQMVYYRDSSDVTSAQAAELARQEQYMVDEERFAEEAKQPYLEFSGPADFGSISFSYPRTWSAYNIENSSKGYEVIFYPGVIPPINDATPVALRVEVINSNYEDELSSYESEVESGKLSASPITISEDQKGVIFNGMQGNAFESSFVLLKLRDKTLLIQTDTNNYLGDFDDVILPSFKYNS